jgi:hypothetical protein
VDGVLLFARASAWLEVETGADARMDLIFAHTVKMQLAGDIFFSMAVDLHSL